MSRRDELMARIGVDPEARADEPSRDDATAWLTDVVSERLLAATPPVFRRDVPVPGSVREWVNAYVADPCSAASLLMLGTTGTAKTHHAWWALRTAVVESYRRNVRPSWKAVKHATFNAQTRPARDDGHEAALSRYSSAGLLLFDDLGAAQFKEWGVEMLHRLVDERWEQQLPTVWTANLTAATAETELVDKVGDRVVSRLMAATWLEFDGEDFRRADV